MEYKEAGCVERDADVTEGGHGGESYLVRRSKLPHLPPCKGFRVVGELLALR